MSVSVRGKLAGILSGLMRILPSALLSIVLAMSISPPRAGCATNAEADGAVDELYKERCASCHGSMGSGHSSRANALDERPRSFHDCDWMEMMSDATLFLIIRDGGDAAGFRPGMPAFGKDLDYDQMVALIAYIRSLCRPSDSFRLHHRAAVKSGRADRPFRGATQDLFDVRNN